MKPGKVKKVDYQYERDGIAGIFLACEPLTGKTSGSCDRATNESDFAHFFR